MKVDFVYNALPDVSLALERGVKVFLYFGGTDYVCNWIGGEAVAKAIDWSGRAEYLKQSYVDWKVRSLVLAKRKTYKNFSLIHVHGAGHTIFLKQREFALEMLKDLLL